MTSSLPFIPGKILEYQIPLSRFLPQVPFGVVNAWLQNQIDKGDWVLDPFGATPCIPIEIARAGYKVLVAAHNPVIRFLIEFLADPPTELQLHSALAHIAAETKGDTRIEGYINSLYLTDCVQCGKSVPAEAFIWERGSGVPSSRIYSCPNCYESGIFPTTEVDARRAARFGSGGLHQARALERIASLDDPDRIHVDQALSVYLPRAVYAIFTLLNKYDNIPQDHQKSLTALLLAALDQGTKLWPHPPERTRPKILVTYSQYREKNIWLELERAVVQWERSLSLFREGSNIIPVTFWPEIPPDSGGICIYDGRFSGLSQELIKDPEPITINASLSALPRPNQAFWSLSVIWSGWLWGHTSASNIKGILRRKRYDWFWHSSALYKTFVNLAHLIRPGIPFFGLISEAEAAYLGSVLSPAWMAGLRLSNIAQRFESGEIQILYKKTDIEGVPEIDHSQISPENFQQLFTKPITEYMLDILEPAKFLSVYAAGFTNIVQNYSPGNSLMQMNPGEVYNKLNSSLQETLSDEENFTKLGKSEISFENASFWLKIKEYNTEYQKGNFLSLADKVEFETAGFLRQNQKTTFFDIDKAVCNLLPGLLTPESNLVIKCLESYAEVSTEEPGLWIIRDQDMLDIRKRDLDQVNSLLKRIGALLDFKTITFENYPNKLSIGSQFKEPLISIWEDNAGQQQFVFYIITTAIFGLITLPVIFGTQNSIGQLAHIPNRVILIPGGRAGLVSYKIKRDTRFGDLLKMDWIFLKFRHLRRLADDQLLTRSKFTHNLTLDPLANTDPQMTLL